MDEATIGRLYNRTNPYRPLDWDDPLNVDIDQKEDEDGARIRGDQWATTFANRIRRSDTPVLDLFSGLPGSGKSTELRRLENILRDTHLPVLIDADEAIDIHSELDLSFLLAIIVYRVERAVLTTERRSPDEALKSGYLQRFVDWLTRTDVEFGKAQYELAEGVSVEAELRTRPSLRQKVSQIVATHLTRFLEEIRAELNALESRAKSQGKRGIVVIFDSLEKLSGTSETQAKVLASAENIFGGSRQYLQLPVHCIFTVPPALLLMDPLYDVRFMPMIKLTTREGEPYKPGREAARDIVRRRITDDELRALLGEDAEQVVERVISDSGGFPRDILRPLHSLLERSKFPVSARDVDRVQFRQRDAIRNTLIASTVDWLARVAETKSISLESELNREEAAKALRMSVVLRYMNDNAWFDVHPLVAQLEEVQEARETYRKRKTADTLVRAP